MINRKLLAPGLLIAISLSLGIGIGSLRAAGVPANDPLLYSGTLSEEGQPVTGARNIGIRLWSSADSTEAADQECETTQGGTQVDTGRFRVVLNADCVAAVKANQELWVEVLVNEVAIGSRAKLGAVPYALEAERASSAAGDLDARLAALEAKSVTFNYGAVCETTGAATVCTCPVGEVAISAGVLPSSSQGAGSVGESRNISSGGRIWQTVCKHDNGTPIPCVVSMVTCARFGP